MACLGFALSVFLHWITQERTIRVDTENHRFTVVRYGYSFATWADQNSKTYEPLIAHAKDSDYWPLSRKRFLQQEESESPIPGIFRAGGGGTQRDMMSFYVGIRHWLVITSCTVAIGITLFAKPVTKFCVTSISRCWQSLED